jgi:hypothetical protein
MSVAAIVGGTVAAGAIGAGGSIIAGGEQAGAAKSAAQLQAQESQNALNQNQQQFNTNQQDIAPFLKGGQQAEGELSGLTSTPGQGLLTPWNQTFQAPTAAQAAQTPGYQFQLQQGENALQNSAAASGGLLTGGNEAALDQYSQGLASQNYQQVYNNQLQQYQQGYNQFENNQANEYNRLAGLSGAGQTAATNLGQLGQQSANTAANIDLTTGAQQGQDIQNAGAATASGYAGASNALAGGANNISQLALLQSLLGGGSSGGSGLTSSDVSGLGMF